MRNPVPQEVKGHWGGERRGTASPAFAQNWAKGSTGAGLCSLLGEMSWGGLSPCPRGWGAPCLQSFHPMSALSRQAVRSSLPPPEQGWAGWQGAGGPGWHWCQGWMEAVWVPRGAARVRQGRKGLGSHRSLLCSRLCCSCLTQIHALPQIYLDSSSGVRQRDARAKAQAPTASSAGVPPHATISVLSPGVGFVRVDGDAAGWCNAGRAMM